MELWTDLFVKTPPPTFNYPTQSTPPAEDLALGTLRTLAPFGTDTPHTIFSAHGALGRWWIGRWTPSKDHFPAFRRCSCVLFNHFSCNKLAPHRASLRLFLANMSLRKAGAFLRPLWNDPRPLIKQGISLEMSSVMEAQSSPKDPWHPHWKALAI